MLRTALLSMIFGISAVTAEAGIFQSCTPSGCTTIRAPVAVTPPPPPVFTTTIETRRKDNGDRVRITTTYRDGTQWTKEKAIIHSGRGIGDAGKSRNRNR